MSPLPTEGEQRRSKNLVHLIEMGDVPAKPASELKEGDVRYYNFSKTGVIHNVRRKGNSVYYDVTEEDGKTYHVRKRASTLVPTRDAVERARDQRKAQRGSASQGSAVQAYGDEQINYGGEVWHRRDVYKDMENKGFTKGQIESYMMGAKTLSHEEASQLPPKGTFGEYNKGSRRKSDGGSRSSSSPSPKKHNPINYGSKKEVTYGHAITHSKGYQKGVGTSVARKEHDKSARIMQDRYGVEHHTPFKAKVRRR